MVNGKTILRGLLSKSAGKSLSIYSWLKEHMYMPPKYSEYGFFDEIPDAEPKMYWVKIKGKTYKASKAIVKGLEILPSVDAPIFLRDKIGFPDYYNGTSMIFKVVNE